MNDSRKDFRQSFPSSFIEVRVVTYRRPVWLRRALESLLRQSEAGWVAVVLDDSPDREGQVVVESLGDSRVQYRPNGKNLGCARNIDQAFRREGFLIDYDYACILEDDNWFSEDFLKSNIEVMARHDVALVLRDQFIVHEERGNVAISSRTCRDMMDEGLWTRGRLMPQMVFHCGLSNGGLMWRRDARTSFFVGEVVENSSVQEQLRSLQLADTFWLAREPLAYFRFDAKGVSQQGFRERARQLRVQQGIAQRILGFAEADFWTQAQIIAERESDSHLRALDFFALMVGNWRYQPRRIESADWWLKQLRHAVVRNLVADPLRPYWRQVCLSEGAGE